MDLCSDKGRKELACILSNRVTGLYRGNNKSTLHGDAEPVVQSCWTSNKESKLSVNNFMNLSLFTKDVEWREGGSS